MEIFETHCIPWDSQNKLGANAKITRAVESIDEHTLKKVCENMRNHLRFPLRNGGGHFENHLNWKHLLLLQIICIIDFPKRWKSFGIVASSFCDFSNQQTVKLNLGRNRGNCTGHRGELHKCFEKIQRVQGTVYKWMKVYRLYWWVYSMHVVESH